MSPDASLNGDMETSKSTSGLWVELVSADGLCTWPLAWRSKRQGSTASSTPEAETISMATGLKGEGLPMQDLFSAALGRTVHLRTSGAPRTRRLRSPRLALVTRLHFGIYPVQSASRRASSTRSSLRAAAAPCSTRHRASTWATCSPSAWIRRPSRPQSSAQASGG